MDENPYASPLADISGAESQWVGVKSGTRADVRSVAKFQKGILACIAVYLLAVIVRFAIPQEMRIVFVIPVLFAILGGAVFTALLAVKVYSPVIGILLTLLTVVPCLGLLALLAINGKATSILRKNGIKVGLLGAKLSDI